MPRLTTLVAESNRGLRSVGAKLSALDSDRAEMLFHAHLRMQTLWCLTRGCLEHSAGDAEDLAFVGQLHYYDKSYDRVTPKADKPLRRTRRQFRTITASRDPILQCASAPH